MLTSTAAASPVDRVPRLSAARPLLPRQACVAPAGRILWREAAVVALILVSQTGGTYAGAATLGALTLWACRSSRCALQATTLSVLVTFANPALVGSQPLVGLLKWLLLFVSLGAILAGWKYQPRKMAKWSGCFALFVGVALGLAMAVSENRALSLLKLGSFSAGVVIALLGVRDRRTSPQYWLNWFSTVSMVVLVLSVPLEFLPAGRYLNGSAFQGILRHPQSYAIYAVPLAVYWTVAFLSDSRASWFLLALVPWAWYSIFASGCRTAFLAVGLSALATTASLLLFPRAPHRTRQRRSTSLKICFALLLTMAVLMIGWPAVSGAVGKFILKGEPGDLAGSSRLVQVRTLLSSIDSTLFTGVGFGLAPAGIEQETQRDELTGLPIGAYTEQGFLPLAVLVQLGVMGAVPLLLFLFVLAWPVVKHAPPAAVAMFWTALSVNFGEMIFFSIGGLGLHMWLLIGCCLGASTVNSGAQKPCG